MYTEVSEDFIKEIASTSRTFRAKLVFSDYEVSDGIYSIKTKGGSCADTDLKAGSTVAATADIEIEQQSYSFKNKEFQLFIGLVLPDRSLEYVPCGVYTVRSAVTTDRKTTLSVADRMYKADKTYKTDLTFSAPAEAIVEEICAAMKVPYDITGVEGVIIPFTPSSKATMREILGKIAALAGKNAMFDRNGQLVFKWYEESGFSTDYDYIDNPDIEESDYTFKYLLCNLDDMESILFGDGNATEGMTIDNEFARREQLQAVWEQLEGFYYRPVQVRMILGDIRLDPWDIFTIKMGNKDVRTIPMQLDFDFDGGLSCNVSASAPDTDSDYQTPAQIQAAKQAETDRNKSIVLTACNQTEQTVGTTEAQLLMLEFTTSKDALVYAVTTIQIDDTSTGGLITAIVKTNGSNHNSYRITAAVGSNLMSFVTVFDDLPNGSNQMEVYISGSEDKMAVVQPKQAVTILAGNGMIAQAEWNGIIQARDEVPPIRIYKARKITVAPFSAKLTATAEEPVKAQFREPAPVMSIHAGKHITIGKILDIPGGNDAAFVDSAQRIFYTRNLKRFTVKKIRFKGSKEE